MRWKICKIFKIRPSDEFFDNIGYFELSWLYTMIAEDEREEFNNRLELVEYLASYSNFEAVKQIQESRKQARYMTDDEFAGSLEHMFGRKVSHFRPEVR